MKIRYVDMDLFIPCLGEEELSSLSFIPRGIFFPLTWNIYIDNRLHWIDKIDTICHELTHLAIEAVSHICFVPIEVREKLHAWFDK